MATEGINRFFNHPDYKGIQIARRIEILFMCSVDERYSLLNSLGLNHKTLAGIDLSGSPEQAMNNLIQGLSRYTGEVISPDMQSPFAFAIIEELTKIQLPAGFLDPLIT